MSEPTFQHDEKAGRFLAQLEGVEVAFSEARAQAKTVMPICPFARKYIRDHDEYFDLVSPNYRAAMRG